MEIHARVISTLVLLVCAARAAATPQAAQKTSRVVQPVLIITHVTVIDATGAPAQPDTTVLIVVIASSRWETAGVFAYLLAQRR